MAGATRSSAVRKRIQQRQIFQEWKQAERYTNHPAHKTKYARRPIIDPENEKTFQKNEAERKNHSWRNREYIEWVEGKPFDQTPIQLKYAQLRIAQIKTYIYTEKEEKDHQEEIRTNRGDKLHTRKWETKKL